MFRSDTPRNHSTRSNILSSALREGGGLRISVAEGTDQVEISQAQGSRFAQMSVSADRISFGPIGKPASLVDTTNATWTVGATGTLIAPRSE